MAAKIRTYIDGATVCSAVVLAPDISYTHPSVDYNNWERMLWCVVFANLLVIFQTNK